MAETIRVAILEDHPAMIEGYKSYLREQPDIQVVAAAAFGEDLPALLETHRPIHLLLLDIRVATVLAVIWAFRSFDIVQVLTGGGPGRATEVLSTHVYKASFVFFRFGYASAIAVTMVLVLLVFAITYTRLLDRD